MYAQHVDCVVMFVSVSSAWCPVSASRPASELLVPRAALEQAVSEFEATAARPPTTHDTRDEGNKAHARIDQDRARTVVVFILLLLLSRARYRRSNLFSKSIGSSSRADPSSSAPAGGIVQCT